MIVKIAFRNQTLHADLTKPLDISIPLKAGAGQLSAWYVPPVSIEPVRTDAFTGSVAEGGSVNFRDIQFNPHGHGTHTECVGHISKVVHSINQTLQQFHFLAQLISVVPDDKGEDTIITPAHLSKIEPSIDALVIRVLPNATDKLSKSYSDSNPPYLTPEAMTLIYEKGIRHLLIDQPSVDRESDGGALAAHHIFWNYPAEENNLRTITELIFVKDEIKDGLFLLNLQIAPFENDASPSKPVLYALN